MYSPLVTVFIPMYNCEEYIKESLDSIINQTYSNIEILIIDDGSTDSSVDIVNSYDDSRIRLVKNIENKGIPFTRNRGLNESNGKYMAIMDADDISDLRRIEKQVDFMEKHQNIDAIGSYYEVFGGRFNRIIKQKYISSEEMEIGLLFFNQIANPTALIRLDTVRKNNISYNINYFVAQDYDMWVQISKVGNLAILPEVLLKYRKGHSNITKKSTINKILQRKHILDSIHTDILQFHNFQLSEDELKLFNEFFGDNPQTKGDVSIFNNLFNVLNKIVEQNRVNGTFREDLLHSIIQYLVSIAVGNHNFNLISKIKLYNGVCKIVGISPSLKDINYFVKKHIYKYLVK